MYIELKKEHIIILFYFILFFLTKIQILLFLFIYLFNVNRFNSSFTSI